MHMLAKILITGSTGMIGTALVKQLVQGGYTQLLTPTHQQLDLCHQTQVAHYFERHQPEYVFHLAARVGGIYANSHYPAQFIYENTQMHCNVIHSAAQYQVKKLLFPGSACTYPKLAPQPIAEKSFLDGLIEPTNLAYATAKINGIVMCQAYRQQHGLNAIVPMPTNAYGIGDNFDPTFSHVIPALMQRIHDAKKQQLPSIVLWGTGQSLREFIYVDDFANALIFLMQAYDGAELINVGSMQEISIIELAKKIAQIVGYEGDIELDVSKPDGAPRKCLDSSKLFELGWQPKISLQEGLSCMYRHHFFSSVASPTSN